MNPNELFTFALLVGIVLSPVLFLLFVMWVMPKGKG
jgi:hypothetical protein